MISNVEKACSRAKSFEVREKSLDVSMYATSDEYLAKVKEMESSRWDLCQIFNEADLAEDEMEIRQRFNLEKEFMELRLTPQEKHDRVWENSVGGTIYANSS